jgi:hypothetical protein
MSQFRRELGRFPPQEEMVVADCHPETQGDRRRGVGTTILTVRKESPGGGGRIDQRLALSSSTRPFLTLGDDRNRPRNGPQRLESFHERLLQTTVLPRPRMTTSIGVWAVIDQTFHECLKIVRDVATRSPDPLKRGSVNSRFEIEPRGARRNWGGGGLFPEQSFRPNSRAVRSLSQSLLQAKGHTCPTNRRLARNCSPLRGKLRTTVSPTLVRQSRRNRFPSAGVPVPSVLRFFSCLLFKYLNVHSCLANKQYRPGPRLRLRPHPTATHVVDGATNLSNHRSASINITADNNTSSMQTHHDW